MPLRLRRLTRSSPHDKRLGRSGLILAAAGFAAVELAFGLLAGFFDGGRAEPLVFLAFRPWLLLAAVWAITGYPFRQRALVLGLGLLLAIVSEAALLIALDAPSASVWRWTWRGLLAGALLLLALDFAFDSGRRFFGAKTGVAIALPLLAIYLLPGSLKGYDTLALGTERTVPKGGPELLLMTGLPIIWGEKGAFDPASRPAAAYRLLQQQYDVKPIDAIEPATLEGKRLLLLAQPRALNPAELVAVDDWVRRGGRLLILDDPALLWPSELPLGDIRRPPPIGLLSPLLGHWGLTITAAGRSSHFADVDGGGAQRRLFLAAPGEITITGTGCTRSQPWLARCRIGRGQTVVLADADLVRDDLWAGTGDHGTSRHYRLSDNAPFIADLLDQLAVRQGAVQRGVVDWLPSVPDRSTAVLAALLPLLGAVLAALVLRPRS